MAAFGAKYINFAPYAEEATDQDIKYGEKVEIGALVQANLTVNLATGEIYGSDVLDESISEFASGSLAVQVTDMVDEVESKIFGSKMETKELVDRSTDNPPIGGVAYYKTLIRNGKRIYRGYYYPKTKASIQNDNAQTKGSSITMSGVDLLFTIYEPKGGAWRKRETFETEEEAIAWVDEKLAASEAV